MSFEERNAWSALVSSFLAWGIIGSQVVADLAGGAFDGPDGLQLWAKAVVWLILWGIGVAIATTVVFAIGHSALHGADGRSTRVDERDRLIALHAMRIVHVIVSVGVVGAILALSQGIGAPLAMTGLLLSCAIGSTLGDCYKVWRYRRGF